MEVPDPSRGEVRDSGCVCCASLLEGHVASPDPFPSRRRVRGHTCDEVESGRPELAGWYGSSVEHIASRVVNPTVLPQRPGWRSSDRSWRMGLRSQPLWGMAA